MRRTAPKPALSLPTRSERKSLVAAAGPEASAAQINNRPEQGRFFDVAMIFLDRKVCARKAAVF